MRQTPEDVANAIDLLQDFAEHNFKIGKILEWPDISPGQRQCALVIACLEHYHERPARAVEVAAVMGRSVEAVEKAFLGAEHPPYHFTELDGVGWSFQPAQGLEYGEA